MAIDGHLWAGRAAASVLRGSCKAQDLRGCDTNFTERTDAHSDVALVHIEVRVWLLVGTELAVRASANCNQIEDVAKIECQRQQESKFEGGQHRHKDPRPAIVSPFQARWAKVLDTEKLQHALPKRIAC